MSIFARVAHLSSFRFNYWLSRQKRRSSFPGQDPWVIKYNDTFLLIQSIMEDSALEIIQFRDSHLTEFIQKKTVWVPKLGSDHAKMLWAPELHMFSSHPNKWYIYYSACDGDNANHRMYVLESGTSDPLGNYHEKGKIYDKKHDEWAIDLTVLEHEDKLYALWSGTDLKNAEQKSSKMETMAIDGNFPQNIYIAPMSNPWTISGERILISTPEYEWEKSVAAINEGPQILKRNNKIFVVYSADGSWMPAYKLGLLYFNGGDILDPLSWVKYNEPVFEKGATSYHGPGHASFINKDDKYYIVYHHKTKEDPGWERMVRVQEFNWLPNDFPQFGNPK